MADMPELYPSNKYSNTAAEVPDRLLEFPGFIQEDFMFDPLQEEFAATGSNGKYSIVKTNDPLMSVGGKIDPSAGGNNGVLYDPHNLYTSHIHHQQRLDLETTPSSGATPFLSHNFWLNQQSTPAPSNSSGTMAFQPVSIASQLPPVGAEYQIQTGGMDSMASPYSPESEGSYDDPNDTFQLRLPPGFDKEPIQKLTEEQLVSLSARDLNTICRDLPEDVVKQLKKRRRTLKNRGYAYNSRVRRVSQKNQLEKERDELQKQIAQLQDKVKTLEREADHWKRKAQIMERGGQV